MIQCLLFVQKYEASSKNANISEIVVTFVPNPSEDMKPFVRNLLAVITGIAIMWLIAFLIITGLVGRLIRSFEQEPSLPGNSVLVVDMSAFHMGEQNE